MKPLGPIPAGFAAIDGELAVQGLKASELVDMAGDSPCFVYSSDMLRARVASLRAAMPEPLSIHYAMKANPFAPVLKLMASLVDGIDIASAGELALAQAAGMDAARISFAGPGKRDRDLEAAIAAGVTLNLESEGECERALAIGQRIGVQPRLAVRVNPDFDLRGSGMRDQLAMLTAMFGHPSGIRYYQALRDYTHQRIASNQPEQNTQRVRLYWMHLMPYFESELLTHLEDDLGGVIAWEEISTIWWEELDEREPLRALARKMLSLFFNGPVHRRIEMALRLIQRYHCQGAIHFSHWGCRQSAGALQVLRARLRREGLPLLVLDGDCIDPSNLQLGPLRTRLDAFIEMLV